MVNNTITIIAGPCSIDKDNINEIYEIAKIEANGKRAVFGTRIVGLKSRTSLNPSGEGMGIDYNVFIKNLNILVNGGSNKDFEVPPSVELTKKIVQDTGMLVAVEIMAPIVQLPLLECSSLRGKLMPWNPAVNQLGWNIKQMVEYAKRNDWYIGIKNGKWLGIETSQAESDSSDIAIPIEKVWAGLSKYATEVNNRVVLIHRGFEVPEKGDFRSLPIHRIAERVKLKTGNRLFFDPSHNFGPKKREYIISGTIEAAKMKINNEEYLYDGILIETGTSQTDTDQHITVNELKEIINELASFRELVEPQVQ